MVSLPYTIATPVPVNTSSPPWRSGSRATPGQGRVIEVSRVTSWRWVQQAVRRVTEVGQIPQGRKSVGTHTLRHSFARHMPLNGIPLNYLSRWLGHGRIQTTLGYLELAPDPSGSLASVP